MLDTKTSTAPIALGSDARMAAQAATVRPNAGETSADISGTSLGEAPALGPPPTNRGPNNSIGDYFRPLRWGVDSLYLSYPGRLLPEAGERLRLLKILAQSDEDNEIALAQYPIDGHIFAVLDKASKGYAYVLEDGAFRITLTRGKQFPQLVKISSGYLAHVGPEHAVVAANFVMAELIDLAQSPSVSRLDLFLDFTSPEDMEWHRSAWVTRAEAIWNFAEDEAFTGWMVGVGSPMVGRLYNKTIQAKKKRLLYLNELWRKVGWNGVDSIWRQEFQMRREILRQFGLVKVPDLLGNLNGLWSYATTEWLRLTMPNLEDKTRSRWPVHPLWGYVSSVDWETNGGPLTRVFKASRIPSDERLVIPALGALTSFMAKNEISDPRQGLDQLYAAMEQHYSTKAAFLGLPFQQYVNERVGVKGRLFNTLLNDPDGLEKLDEQHSAESALTYRRARDGERG